MSSADGGAHFIISYDVFLRLIAAYIRKKTRRPSFGVNSVDTQVCIIRIGAQDQPDQTSNMHQL